MDGQGFVHLRVRSAYSLLEGAIKAEQMMRDGSPEPSAIMWRRQR